jgi:hypothetical protein
VKPYVVQVTITPSDGLHAPHVNVNAGVIEDGKMVQFGDRGTIIRALEIAKEAILNTVAFGEQPRIQPVLAMPKRNGN